MARRLPYHQSLFDLLRMDVGEDVQARALIEECEARCGRRLPEALRQWYRFPDWHSLWQEYSNEDRPTPLDRVLDHFACGPLPPDDEQRIVVLAENQNILLWFVALDGSDDPPVYAFAVGGAPRQKVADHFSSFLLRWFADFYSLPRLSTTRDRPDLNGLWLCAPDAAAVAPPYLDYLMETMQEDSRREVAAGVMQYEYRSEHGRVRVTTDDAREPDGRAAWWLSAESAQELYALAKSVLWCGDVLQALTHHRPVARTVLDQLWAEAASA